MEIIRGVTGICTGSGHSTIQMRACTTIIVSVFDRVHARYKFGFLPRMAWGYVKLGMRKIIVIFISPSLRSSGEWTPRGSAVPLGGHHLDEGGVRWPRGISRVLFVWKHPGSYGTTHMQTCYEEDL